MTTIREALTAVFLSAALVHPAAAQSGEQPSAPETDISGGSGDLSRKLNDSAGVIHPQGQVDPGMQKTPSATGTMPVVPPPGTPENHSDVVPK